MTRRLRITTAALSLLLVAAGAQYAVAQNSPRNDRNATRDTAPARKIVPPNRSVGTVVRPGVLDSNLTFLTKDECWGLGGSVGTSTSSMACTKGQACYTAGQDGIVHSACITE